MDPTPVFKSPIGSSRAPDMEETRKVLTRVRSKILNNETNILRANGESENSISKRENTKVMINATSTCFQSNSNLGFFKAEHRSTKGDNEVETMIWLARFDLIYSTFR
jgi:hypothetical protein